MLKAGFTIRLARKLMMFPVLALASRTTIAYDLAGGAFVKSFTRNGIPLTHTSDTTVNCSHGQRVASDQTLAID